ncbi:MAG: MBL fold metallo-hydrolase [Actinomycetota bacterium]
MADKPLEHRRREPAPGVFRLLLSLPFPGLTRVNAYLLTGDDGATLVDCGVGRDSGSGTDPFEDLRAAIAATDTPAGSIDRLVVTHTHVDHYGLAARVVDELGCELWMHEDARLELDAYADPAATAERLRGMLADHGVGEADLDELTAFEDWRHFISGVAHPTKPLGGGESFSAGRRWEVVHTPGHARSHICLWSPDEGILVSGDHLLPTVTPHIDFRRGADEDPLGEFLASLEKVEDLDPVLTLPGHGRPFDEGAERARVVARHHDRRLGSILQVIRHDHRTANEITEDVFGSTLLNFERRLALGETLAHLAYLRRRGEIERLQRDDGTYVFKKVKRRRDVSDDDDG